MEVKTVLIIGLGNIGKPLYEIIKGVYKVHGLDVDSKKNLDGEINSQIDVMHICFGHSVSRDATPKFITTVAGYMGKFNPQLTIIESTVLPGTTNKIWQITKKKIVHSPVRGRKAEGFKWGYYTYTKFIGPVKTEFGKLADEYYRSLGFKTHVCKSALETEFMKLMNGAYYGLMIAWFQEIRRICEEFNLNEEDILEFYRTNESESGGEHKRPIFYPGFIGGHCIIPNIRLLQVTFDSKFLEAILESNERVKLLSK